MAASQAILAQALPATSSVACSSGAVSQRKSVSTILVAPFKGSVAGLRWESQQAKVRQALSISLSLPLSVGAIAAVLILRSCNCGRFLPQEWVWTLASRDKLAGLSP